MEMIQEEIKAAEEIAKVEKGLIEKKLALRQKELEFMTQDLESEKETGEEDEDE